MDKNKQANTFGVKSVATELLTQDVNKSLINDVNTSTLSMQIDNGLSSSYILIPPGSTAVPAQQSNTHELQESYINLINTCGDVSNSILLSEPILQQALNQDGQNIDAEKERMKLKNFLEGKIEKEFIPEPKLLKNSPKSVALSMIRCFNCQGIFSKKLFQNHICDFDESHNPIMLSNSTTDRKNSLHPLAVLSKKPDSERIIIENQIRMKRFLKDDLKFDLDKIELTVNKKNKDSNECTMCERKFVHASGLIRHMEKHAMDLIPTNVHSNHNGCQTVHGLRLTFKCSYCGRIFFDNYSADEHIKTHYYEGTIYKPNQQEQQQKQQLDGSLTIMKPLSTTQQINFCELIESAEKALDVVKGFANNSDTSLLVTENFDRVVKLPVLSSMLQCEFCDYIFSDITYLLTHSTTHSPQRPYECTACNIAMCTLKDATNHTQTECSYNRENMRQLQITLQRLYACNVCEDKFLTLEHLAEHRHSTFHYLPRESTICGQLALPCDNCEETFTKISEATIHYDDKHLHKRRREREIRSSNLTASGRIRQYLCDICGKSYTQSSHLWQHLRFHQGVKPFECPEEGCGRKFTIRPDLNDHIRKCHTGERPYHCLVCGKRFLTGSVFYQHRLIHRGERRYECDECGKRFYRADALKNHQRIHTGEKPFSCLFCTKTFRQRGDRDKHIRARHSHLDANSKLMMQMQKYQLEATAALKKNGNNEEFNRRLGTEMVIQNKYCAMANFPALVEGSIKDQNKLSSSNINTFQYNEGEFIATPTPHYLNNENAIDVGTEGLQNT